MAEYLSEHFTLEEMTFSETARARRINNTPTPAHKKTLKHTCQYLLEKIRTLLNEKYKEYKGKKVKQVSIRVTSGYRSPNLNAAVGGSSTSQHVNGCAADIEAIEVYTDGTKGVLPYTELYEDIKAWTKAKKISVDQCIQEYSKGAAWVHVSLKQQIADSRKQFLKYINGTYKVDCILK